MKRSFIVILPVISILLLSASSDTALAQTTGTVNPSAAPTEPSVEEYVPPGGCMPIGLTASGEVVFPIQCKEFIERHRGKAVEGKPAASEEKAAVSEEKPAVVEATPVAKESESAPPVISKPPIKALETVSKRAEPQPRRRPDDGYCSQQYRSYDPASGTYTGYDGLRHRCR
jgi:hypothetical protein